MLNPLAIRRQQFTRSFRGYDTDEVEGFLKQIADQWEQLAEEKRLAEERVREIEGKLKHYERVELALQEALEASRESAQRAQAAAEQKARLIVEEAELRAQRILQDAEQERYGVRQDLARLTGRQNEVAARLRAFLMSELEILAQFQGDDPVGFIRLVSSSEPEGRVPAQLARRPEPEDAEVAEAAASAEASSAEASSAEASSAGAAATGAAATGAAATGAASEDAPAAGDASARMPSGAPSAMPPETFDLRSLVTGAQDEPDRVAASEEERERIRRILDDLD
ncbi:MAG: DivIVA domain-containing protein [Rubricoccaceae bacterium]